MQLTLYLFFAGGCFEAMSHYAEVLGGEIGHVTRNADAPDAESRMPVGDALIMNMHIRLGSCRIMASAMPAGMYTPPRSFRVQIEPTSRDEFDRIFAALSKAASAIEMPPGETFWAERFAMVTDRYGTPWMLNYEGAKVSGSA